MRRIALLALLWTAFSLAFGQWSTDPLNPNPVAAFNAEQVIPKVAIAPSGNTYLCRFDNSGGSYKVYLQLFSPQGEALWTAPAGLLVSENAQMSWLTDYEMTVDAEGNAVIVFQDIRNAGVNNVYAYKISPAGTFLWGANGVALSTDTNTEISNMPPTVFTATDNSTYVAWQRTVGSVTSVRMNRLNSAGQKRWGEDGVTLTPATGNYNWPQIIQSDGDNILLKYYHDTGPFWAPNRVVWVAKYDTAGQQLWNSVITDALGLPAWQQVIPFEPDGSGGAILAWYEDREVDMDNDIYVQRVTSAGAVTMGEDGALASVDPGNQQYYPVAAVDALNQQVYVFFRVTGPNQDSWGLGRQLLSFTGSRLWGETAPLFLAIGGEEANTIGAYYTERGAICLYSHGGDNLAASCWRSSGNQGWIAGPTEIATSAPDKYHFDLDTHSDQWAVLAWEQGATNMDIYAMRLNGDGSLGMQYPAPIGLTATLNPPFGATLSWQAPSQSLVPDSYYVYINAELGQVVNHPTTTYTFDNLTPGPYAFFVKARYGDLYSPPSDTVYLNVEVVGNGDPALPAIPAFLRVWPNPFAGAASVSFNLTKARADCRLIVYNLRGEKLVQRDFAAEAGIHNLDLNGTSFRLPGSGIYLLRLELGGEVRTAKAVYIQ